MGMTINEFEIIKQDTIKTEQEKQEEWIEGELDYLDGPWIY